MGLNDRYHMCLAKCRGLYDRGILQAPGVEPDTSMITADKLMYSYAIDLCQTAGLDELCGSLVEVSLVNICFWISKAKSNASCSIV